MSYGRPMSNAPSFQLALRGYDRADVDALISQIVPALDSRDPALTAKALSSLGEAAFAIRMRGYDRAAVDAYLDQARARLTGS